jgi:hypothetical protein
MAAAIRSSETSVLTRATRRNIPEYAILSFFPIPSNDPFCQIYLRGYEQFCAELVVSLKTKKKQTPWTLFRRRTIPSILSELIRTNSLVGAEPVFTLRLLCSYSGTSQHFMEPQQSPNARYPETHQSSQFNVRFDVFTVVTMKNVAFWDKNPSSYLTEDITSPLQSSAC